MKIVHICLCGPVTDGWTYQDNLLPKYHRKLGLETTLITSKFIWNNKGQIIKDKRDKYTNEDGVNVIRLNNRFRTNISSKFKLYKDIYKTLSNESPDIIFVHGIQFLDLRKVLKYVKGHPNVKVYADNHADNINSAKNWLSKYFLHRVIWKKNSQSIVPYLEKFYGVLPARVTFLKEMYKVPEDKLDLLVLGADDEKVLEAKRSKTKLNIRSKYGIEESDFLIMTGGKIDATKQQTLTLMEVIKNIPNENIKLIVFGPVSEEIKIQFYNLLDNHKIKYIKWVSPDQVYNYFNISDLVIFPGSHSVFWEQVAGLGIPMLLKYWEGVTHLDVGGNCEFLYEDSEEEMREKILGIVNNEEKYRYMKNSAEKNAGSVFSYYSIAKSSIKF